MSRGRGLIYGYLVTQNKTLRYGRWSLLGFAAVFIVYHCCHHQLHPVIGALHTGAVVLVAEIIGRVLFDPYPTYARLLELVRLEMRRTVQPVRRDIEQLRAVVDEIHNRVSVLGNPLQERQNPGGVKAVHPRMDFRLFIGSTAKGDTVWFFDTYIPDFGQYVQLIKEAVKRGVEFRFLIVHPVCYFARDRSFEITNSPSAQGENFFTGLREYHRLIAQLSARFPNAVLARHFSRPASVPIYLIVGEDGAPTCAFQSYYFREASVAAWQLEFGPGDIITWFHEYVGSKWKENERNVITIDSVPAEPTSPV